MKTFDEIFPEKAAARDANKKDLNAQAKKDRSLFNSVFSTDNGRRALRRIMEKCHYQKPCSTFAEDGRELTEILRVRESQRLIYLWLRGFVNNETLKRVEIGD